MRTKKSNNNKLSTSKSGSSDGALLVASHQIDNNPVLFEDKSGKTTYPSATQLPYIKCHPCQLTRQQKEQCLNSLIMDQVLPIHLPISL